MLLWTLWLAKGKGMANQSGSSWFTAWPEGKHGLTISLWTWTFYPHCLSGIIISRTLPLPPPRLYFLSLGTLSRPPLARFPPRIIPSSIHPPFRWTWGPCSSSDIGPLNPDQNEFLCGHEGCFEFCERRKKKKRNGESFGEQRVAVSQSAVECVLLWGSLPVCLPCLFLYLTEVWCGSISAV